jgi:GTP pyrophosphokinase
LISSPKSTGYEALHITVMGPKGYSWKCKSEVSVWTKLVERLCSALQIKNGNTGRRRLGLVKFTKRSPRKFRNQQVDLSKISNESVLKEIYVLHLKRHQSLYQRGNLIDFAFSIHSEIGIKTRGTRVNGN